MRMISVFRGTKKSYISGKLPLETRITIAIFDLRFEK
jgi:hypothetical protein